MYKITKYIPAAIAVSISLIPQLSFAQNLIGTTSSQINVRSCSYYQTGQPDHRRMAVGFGIMTNDARLQGALLQSVENRRVAAGCTSEISANFCENQFFDMSTSLLTTTMPISPGARAFHTTMDMLAASDGSEQRENLGGLLGGVVGGVTGLAITGKTRDGVFGGIAGALSGRSIASGAGSYSDCQKLQTLYANLTERMLQTNFQRPRNERNLHRSIMNAAAQLGRDEQVIASGMIELMTVMADRVDGVNR